ncbi:MAG: DinB family protein [Candidatus Thorarchaeota archaeon]
MTFKNLGQFHLWAGEKIRPIVESLSEKDYNKKFDTRSVRSICCHIVAALETCFLIDSRSDDKSVYDWIEQASKLEILNRWEWLDRRLSRVIQEIPQGTVPVPHITEEPFDIDLFDFFLQYLIHTTHHRGQLAHLLRRLEKDVPPTDYLFFLAEKAGRL